MKKLKQTIMLGDVIYVADLKELSCSEFYVREIALESELISFHKHTCARDWECRIISDLNYRELSFQSWNGNRFITRDNFLVSTKKKDLEKIIAEKTIAQHKQKIDDCQLQILKHWDEIQKANAVLFNLI